MEQKPKFKIQLVVLSFIVSIFLNSVVNAANSVPHKFIYEGRLLNSGGTSAITTSQSFRFSLWSASAVVAGDVVAGSIDTLAPNYGGWQEVQTVTPNSDGFFSFELGSATPLPAIDYTKHLYLQVEVKPSGDPDTSYEVLDRSPSDPLVDRSPIGSVPYALNSDLLDNADIGTSDGDIVLLGTGDQWPVSTIPGGTNENKFTIDYNDDSAGTIDLQFGNSLSKMLSWDTGSDYFNFNDDVYIQGNVSAEGDLLLDADDTSGDINIQFGTTLAEVIKWNAGNSRFDISDDVYVDGNLEVNGNVDFNQNKAIEMVLDQGTSFPTIPAPVEGQTYYRTDLNAAYIYDGSSWVALASGAGSGIIFLSPMYPHATYYPDGADNVGRLTYYFDNTNIENANRWETSRPTAQDYDIVIRVQLPDDFSSWATNPIEFKYRTDTTNSAQNKLDVSMLDTADTSVTLSNNSNLVSTSAGTWVESTNIGITGGTWTSGDWITFAIKTTATNAGGSETGSIVLNYNTSS